MPLTQDLTKFTTASQQIVTYNYTDFIQNIGYLKFYGMSTEDDTSTDYLLMSIAMSSATKYIANFGAGTTTLDFEIDFKNNANIEGAAIVNAKWIVVKTANPYTAMLDISILKNSTVIGTVGLTDVTTEQDERIVVKIPVTKTHFSIGDTLKLRFYLRGSPVTGQSGILFDPLNETVTTSLVPGGGGGTQDYTDSKLEAYIPFKLDI